MINRPVNYIFLEGPDLSGKTTFYEKLHNASGYQWNIQDRSALSMLVHAKLYNRDTFNCTEQLRYELNNLNNIMIIMLPEWNIIAKRFNLRGDPIQNITSLRKIYDLFTDAANELQSYPNVIVLKQEVDDQTVQYIKNHITYYENASILDIKNNCMNACQTKENNECLGLNFTLFDPGTFESIDEGDLLYDKEVDYYNDIVVEIKQKIQKELAGNNKYKKKEDKFSRRFIYTSNTCISLAHFIYRNEGLDCKFFLRSSNVKDTLYYDLNFLNYLSKEVYNTLDIENKFCRMNFVINSGHIIETNI